MMKSPNRKEPPTVKPFGKMTVPPEDLSLLPNGITLHSFSGGDQPICKLSIAFHGGIREIGSEATANMVLSQIFEGAGNKTASQIADILDYNGARIGVRSQVHHSVLDVWMLNERVPQILDLLKECISSPAYPQNELDTAKLRATAAFLSSREDVATLAGEALTKLIYGEGHPLARPMSEEVIALVDRAGLQAAHRRLLVPENTDVFLSGMIDGDVERAVYDFLCELPSMGPSFKPVVEPIRPEEPGKKVYVGMEGALQDAIMAGLPAPGRDSEDYSLLRFTIMALGGYFGSRLMTNIREDKGLTYGISSSLLGNYEGSYMTIGAQCDGAYTERVLDEIYAEMRGLVSNPPKDDELRRLKLHAATNLAEILDTPAGIMGYYANRLFVGTPDDYFARQQAAIDALTPEIIAAMAEKYLQPENLRVAICGDYDRRS